MSKIIGVTVGTPTSPKKIENEIKPVKTVNGQEPDENGNVEVVGNNGVDGVSPTISVSTITGGHRITITDKDGTKNVDVMDGADGNDGNDGNDGITPVKGVDYFDGKDGTSVTVTKVTESAEDGGSNAVTFSDGKTLTVKNGKKGSKGDAFTYEDFTAEQLAALKGANGNNGRGIKSVTRTGGNGEAGTTDTYTITYTDNTTSTFTVHNGMDGRTPYIHDGEWWIGDTPLGVKAEGKDGVSITAAYINDIGQLCLDTTDGDSVAVGYVIGRDGNDGTSVTITKVTESDEGGGESIVYFSDGNTLTVKNGRHGDPGSDGNDGVGIANIAKTATSGRVDTYTITFTDGTTSTFTVTNGKDGEGANIDLSELFTVEKVTTVDNYATGTSDTRIISNGIVWQDTISFNDGADFYQEATGLFKVPFAAGKNITFELDGNVVKVNLAEVINNLTTNSTDKPLSAAQGVVLKALIDAITVPTKVSQLTNDAKYLTSFTETDPTVPSWAKATSKPSYSKSEVGLGNVDNVKQYSASNPPPYPVTSVNGKTGAVTISVPSKVSELDNDSKFLTAVPSEYVTESELTAKKYLTSIPSEYVTETELNNKGYLTTHQDISGKADKSSAETWTFKLKDGSTVTKKVVLA